MPPLKHAPMRRASAALPSDLRAVLGQSIGAALSPRSVQGSGAGGGDATGGVAGGTGRSGGAGQEGHNDDRGSGRVMSGRTYAFATIDFGDTDSIRAMVAGLVVDDEIVGTKELHVRLRSCGVNAICT